MDVISKIIAELARRTERLLAQRALYRERKGGRSATLADRLTAKLSQEELVNWIQKVQTTEAERGRVTPTSKLSSPANRSLIGKKSTEGG